MRSIAAAAAGVAIGVWMMLAPAVMDYAGSAAANDRIFGPTAAAIAWVAGSAPMRSVRWANVAIGAWVAVSPLLLDHSLSAAANSIASGILLVITALLVGPVETERFGGGWVALIRRDRG